ncbi:MAG: hypothetical protein AAGG75_04015 [Bacteroidota bacterium]
MKKLILVLFLALSIVGCKKNEDAPRGDLNVFVTFNNAIVARGATVTTLPATVQGTTDEFGSVLLSDLEVGTYEVFASTPNAGSGKTVATIKADQFTQVVIDISTNTVSESSPDIELISPIFNAAFSEGEEIVFSARITDDITAPQNIKVTWTSDIDGVINTDAPAVDGSVAFSFSGLSRANHSITLAAEDENGNRSEALLLINTFFPSPITLLGPIKDNGKVILNWTYEGTGFQSYEVYRMNGDCGTFQELIGTITDAATKTFTDRSPPIEYQVCYFVKITNQEGFSRNSNPQTVETPGGQVFNFEAFDVLQHPTQKFIYLLDRGGQRLIKYDYEKQEVATEVPLQGSANHCTIGNNGFGMEVYVPTEDGWVYAYNADNLTLNTTINVGIYIRSVAVDEMGRVIVSTRPSPWWEMPFRVFDRANGQMLDGGGQYDNTLVRKLGNTNEFVTITNGQSPPDMEYYKLDNNGRILQHEMDNQHGSYPLDGQIFRVSSAGFSITSRFGAVYLANSSMEYKGQLQRGDSEFTEFAFSEDGQTIYAATQNERSIQVYSYPSLIRSTTYTTRGFPVFVFKAGNQLIVLSKSNESAINTGIEVIDL